MLAIPYGSGCKQLTSKALHSCELMQSSHTALSLHSDTTHIVNVDLPPALPSLKKELAKNTNFLKKNTAFIELPLHHHSLWWLQQEKELIV